ncbi:MAG TPA: ribbon-helix-helix domain-containing protein [Candidatus Nanoarchaeia archaeon]|nr:ribbon-helix-helix domain-containing protein [Candidatus Nanoarchaeia archaeon]
MATELVTFKMDDKLLKEVDRTAKQAGFHNRTEFIRAALRKQIDETKIREAMKKIAHIRGASKRKTTEEEYERARTFEFYEKNKGSGEEIFRRLGL